MLPSRTISLQLFCGLFICLLGAHEGYLLSTLKSSNVFRCQTLLNRPCKHIQRNRCLSFTRPNQKSNLLVVAAEAVPGQEGATTEDPPLFDVGTWEAYESVIQEVLTHTRVVQNHKIENMAGVKDYILSNRRFLATPSPLTSGGNMRDDMMAQKLQFLEHFKLSHVQYDFAMRCLVYIGDHCAKRKDPRPVFVAWEKIKEIGLVPRENCISTFMYALSLDESLNDSLVEVATFHDLFFSPNEKTVTLRIKSLIAKGDAASAEKMLTSIPVRLLT
jgi:hypothetical protein